MMAKMSKTSETAKTSEPKTSRERPTPKERADFESFARSALGKHKPPPKPPPKPPNETPISPSKPDRDPVGLSVS
jgi:hypothetical protein